MARVRVALVAVALVVSTVAVGCSGKGGSDASTTTGKAGAGGTTTKVAHGLSAADLSTKLAAAGIGTYAGYTASTPSAPVTDPGPVHLQKAQVEFLARQVRAGSGTVGAQLDTLVGPLTGAPPFSYVVAGYVKAAKTPGAALARSIMGDQAWSKAPQLVFPDVVLALFTDDVARDGEKAPAGDLRSSSTGPVVLARPGSGRALDDGGVGAICTQLQGWADNVIATVIEALKVDTSQGGVTGVLGTIWNTVVDLAASAASAVVGVLTAPVRAVIQGALGVVGTLSMLSWAVRPFTVSATFDTPGVQFGVGSGNPASFTATADTGAPVDWPDGLPECASAAGVDLPDLSSAGGSKVTWTPEGIDAVGTDVTQDDVLAKDNTAKLRFTTRTESQDAHDKGAEVDNPVAVSVSVERTKIKDLGPLLENLALGGLTGLAKDVVSSVYGVLTKPIFDRLAQVMAADGAGSGVVISHGPPPDEPPSSTTAPKDECAGVQEGSVPDGDWKGPITLGVNGSTANTSGSILSTGSGQMEVVVKDGKVTSGTWTMKFDSSGTLTTAESTATLKGVTGTITGTVSGPASKPALVGSAGIGGSIDVTVSGFSTNVPLGQTVTATAALTVDQSTCAKVGGTFIPSFNQNAGGYAVFDGIARWEATPA